MSNKTPKLVVPKVFVDLVLKSFNLAPKSKSKYIFNGRDVDRPKLLYHLLEKQPRWLDVNNPNLIRYYNQGGGAFNKYVVLFDVEMAAVLDKKVQAVSRQKSSNGGGWDLSQLDILMDYSNGEKIMYNTVTGRISEYSYRAFEDMLKSTNPDLFEEKRADMKDCNFSYIPKSGPALSKGEFEGMAGVWRLNQYDAPPWMGEKVVDDGSIALFDEFFSHICPEPVWKQELINWLFTAVNGKNETALVINGVKGLGKNVMSLMMKALVGDKHFNMAHQGFLDTAFNSILVNNRILHIDELLINTPTRKNKLKAYFNEDQNPEFKGKDADRTVKTYNSFYITGNSPSDLLVEYDDRRLLILDTGPDDLNKVWGEDKIDDFIHYLSGRTDIDDLDVDGGGGSLSFKALLGAYIMQNGEIIKGTKPRKGETFYRLVVESLLPWQRFVYDQFEEEGHGYEIDYKVLKRRFKDSDSAYGSVMQSKGEVKSWVNSFKDKNGKKIGAVVDDGDGKNWIATSLMGDAALPKAWEVDMGTEDYLLEGL